MKARFLYSRENIELLFSSEGQDQMVTLTLTEGNRTLIKRIEGEEVPPFFQLVESFIARAKAYKQSENQPKSMGDNLAQLTPNYNVETHYIPLEDYAESIEIQAGTFRVRLLEKLKFSDFKGSREAEVFIGLPQEDIDLFTIEQIQNATGDFMEAMGFELETQDEPVFGSFFQRLKFLLKGEVKEEVSDIYSKGKTALEMQFISLPHAEATSKLATAAASIITALSTTENAALRLGAILLVKVTRDGVPQIVTETISPELSALLDKNPALLQNPNIVFDLISGMRAPDKTIGESGSAEVME